MKLVPKRVSQLGRVVTGKTPPTIRQELFDGEYLFVTPSDLDYNHYYCRETERSVSEHAKAALPNQFIPAGAVMFTCIGATIGKCAIAPEECLTNQQINSVVANDETDPKFLYYLLCKNVDIVKGMGGGAATPIINKSTFEDIEFLVPPLREQKEIGRILSVYDDLIENNQRRIALLEEAARMLYREWFVHFRFPGHEHVKIINGLPEGWELATFGDLFDFQNGFAFKSSTYAADGKYGVVTIKNVHDGKFVSDCSSRIDAAPEQMNKHCFLASGDILLSLTGNVGRSCIVYGENYLLNQRVAKIVGKNGITPQFAYWTFSNTKTQIFLENLAYGVAQLNLSPVLLAAQPFSRPSRQLVELFSNSTESVMDQIVILNLSIAELARARDLLLQRLMNGEIAV